MPPTCTLGTRVRVVAAALLLGALMLPQYTCTRYQAADGTIIDYVAHSADSVAYRAVVEPHYALEDFHPGEAGAWLVLAAFTWPVVALALRTRARKRGSALGLESSKRR